MVCVEGCVCVCPCIDMDYVYMKTLVFFFLNTVSLYRLQVVGVALQR